MGTRSLTRVFDEKQRYEVHVPHNGPVLLKCLDHFEGSPSEMLGWISKQEATTHGD